MAIRLIITLQAVAGKTDEIITNFSRRCPEVMGEPGCEQFEVFQSLIDPKKFVVLEHWQDQQALDVHAKLPPASPMPQGLLVDKGQREDYEYNRTR